MTDRELPVSADKGLYKNKNWCCCREELVQINCICKSDISFSKAAKIFKIQLLFSKIKFESASIKIN